MKQVAEEQQVRLPALDDDLFIDDTGLDSLAFAILVERLEVDFGINPFTATTAFPRTVGDFVQAYENTTAQGPHAS